MGNIRSLADVLSIIRRHFILMFTLFFLGCLVTLFLVAKQIRSYESVAVLQMELPRVAANTAPGESLSHSSQRLQLLEQQLVSRDSLLSLAERHNLLEDLPALSPTQKLAILRQSVRIEPVRGPQQPYGSDPAISALVIRVAMQDRQVAADVANDLAQQILDGTADRQTAVARETLDFFAREEARITTELAALEEEITRFKNDNIDALPESVVARRDELATLETQARDYDRELMEITQELTPLRAGTPRAVELRRIATLEARRDALQARMDGVTERTRRLETSLAQTPMVETLLGNLLRRQQQLQDQYSVINRRRAEAETTQRLESDRQTERFTLLEAALPADYPLSSGRRKILLVGAMASGMLALGVAFLLELRKPVIRSARQLEQITGLRPVIALPMLNPTGRRKTARRDRSKSA